MEIGRISFGDVGLAIFGIGMILAFFKHCGKVCCLMHKLKRLDKYTMKCGLIKHISIILLEILSGSGEHFLGFFICFHIFLISVVVIEWNLKFT
jgi:hypothetical protein